MNTINYHNILCKLERITKNSWGYTGVDRWQLWAKQNENSPAVLEANNFTYFDRGLWFLDIDDDTVKNIENDMISRSNLSINSNENPNM